MSVTPDLHTVGLECSCVDHWWVIIANVCEVNTELTSQSELCVMWRWIWLCDHRRINRNNGHDVATKRSKLLSGSAQDWCNDVTILHQRSPDYLDTTYWICLMLNISVLVCQSWQGVHQARINRIIFLTLNIELFDPILAEGQELSWKI